MGLSVQKTDSQTSNTIHTKSQSLIKVWNPKTSAKEKKEGWWVTVSTTQFKGSVSCHVRQQCAEMGTLSGERWEETVSCNTVFSNSRAEGGLRRYLFYLSCCPPFPSYTCSLQCQGKAHWHTSHISKLLQIYFLKFILLIQSIFKVFIFLEC